MELFKIILSNLLFKLNLLIGTQFKRIFNNDKSIHFLHFENWGNVPKKRENSNDKFGTAESLVNKVKEKRTQETLNININLNLICIYQLLIVFHLLFY